MSSEQRSVVSRSGEVDDTGTHASVEPQRNKVSRHQNLRANSRRNHLHRTVVMHVADRAAAAARNAALMRRYLMSASASASASASGSSTHESRRVTNLDRFLYSVTPVVRAKISQEVNASKEGEPRPYFCLGDLWKTFEEWSAYGVGVPYVLNGRHLTTQYYVPYLSGMQVYIDPKKPPKTIGGLEEEKDVKSHEPDQETDLVSDGSFASLNLNNQKLKQVGLSESDNKTEVCGSRDTLAFEFMEPEGPYTRKPLSVQVSVLESLFPELSKYRSCDLLPSSWICVAWYPIYRIPVGPTQEELNACFLTLHPLSTQPGSSSKRVGREISPSPWVSLPAIGLVSYKLKGSIISPRDHYEREQEHNLMMDASIWLNNLQPLLPDYQFFVRRY